LENMLDYKLGKFRQNGKYSSYFYSKMNMGNWIFELGSVFAGAIQQWRQQSDNMAKTIFY
jgi:hypothetical protein